LSAMSMRARAPRSFSNISAPNTSFVSLQAKWSGVQPWEFHHKEEQFG
jgi:hypothetical protein